MSARIFGLREATVIIGDECLAFPMQLFSFRIVFCLPVKVDILPHPYEASNLVRRRIVFHQVT